MVFLKGLRFLLQLLLLWPFQLSLPPLSLPLAFPLLLLSFALLLPTLSGVGEVSLGELVLVMFQILVGPIGVLVSDF